MMARFNAATLSARARHGRQTLSLRGIGATARPQIFLHDDRESAITGEEFPLNNRLSLYSVDRYPQDRFRNHPVIGGCRKAMTDRGDGDTRNRAANRDGPVLWDLPPGT